MNSVNSESSMCYVRVISLHLNIHTMSQKSWSIHIMLNYISKLSKSVLYFKCCKCCQTKQLWKDVGTLMYHVQRYGVSKIEASV